ncbi:MAG: hypothetical protein ACRD43_05945 [Pyrinomonadaceae bacterium]
MAEQISYYWEIDDFVDTGHPLQERLVLTEWIPAPPDISGAEEPITDIQIRVERIADSRTAQFFKIYLQNASLPRITFGEVVEENGEVIRRNKWIVNGATIPIMEQRDRLEGEHEWATRPYIDEFILQL